MYREHSVAVVVPAYNEGETIVEVIRTVPSFVDRMYVVDDGSTDDTWDVIQEQAETTNEATSTTDGFDRRVVPIQHEENRGVGGALKTGYQRALEDDIAVTAVMAGDGQMDPDELHRYLDPIVADDADYAKGNRFMEREDIGDMPTFRLFGNALLSLLTKAASGYWRISDPQNGYTAISRRALEAVDIDSLYEDYGFANDLLVKLNAANLRVADVPRSATYGYEDDDWDSSIELGEFAPTLSMLLARDFCWRLWRTASDRDDTSLALSYGLAVVVAGASIVGLLASLAGKGDEEGSIWPVALVAGVFLSILAIGLDAVTNGDLERKVGREEYD